MRKLEDLEMKGAKFMNVTANDRRPCSIADSIINSCKEVKEMREGRAPERSLNDLFTKINQWRDEGN